MPVLEPPPPRSPAPLRARCRLLIEAAVAATPGDAVLLSGGLDSSIVAACAAGQGRRLLAVTAALPDAPDVAASRRVAGLLGVKHELVPLTIHDLEALTAETAQMLRTFDPMEVRNSAVQLHGLRVAKELGAMCVLTGDAGDELFAGYGYMTAMPPEQLTAYRKRIAATMTFSAPRLAAGLGIEVAAPYARPEVEEFALSLPNEVLVQEWLGRLWGKWILREAFAGLLPPETLYRWKDPIEVGSGSTRLTAHWPQRLGAEFQGVQERVLREEGVVLRDPEHLAYYRAYRERFPPPRAIEGEGPRCQGCRAPKRAPEARYCPVCGAWPA